MGTSSRASIGLWCRVWWDAGKSAESLTFLAEGLSPLSRVVLVTLNAKFVHSSLALRCLRAAVEDNHEVILKEFTIHDPVETLVGGIFACAPDVIGVSCYIWNIEETARILPVLRKVLPDVMIVLGGPEVSYDTEYFMDRLPVVDAIVIGEGEEAFRELVDARAAGLRLAEIPGLCLREADGMVKRTPPRTKVSRLDSLPTPYSTVHMEELKNRIVYYEASRGCPFSCQFCLSSIESGVRYYSLERVKTDLARLIDAGVRQIKFVDRTFNLRKDFALEIFSFLIQNPGDTTFHFEITGDILRPDVVDWLCEHVPKGLFRFEIGVQSTNDVTNDIVARRQDFAKLSRTVTRLKQSGKIVQHLDLIAGLPQEDYSSFERTFNDVFALSPEELQLGFLKLLRGTGLRRMASQFGYVYMDTAPYEMLFNQCLTYAEVLRLKRLEDVLEKFYNSGWFPHIIHDAVTRLFASPFAFFQTFGDFWSERGYARIGHQPLDLVRRLEAFLIESEVYDEVAQALLRADYLLREKLRPRTLWWQRMDTPFSGVYNDRVNWRTLNPPLRQEDVAKPDWYKRAVIDTIPALAWDMLCTDGTQRLRETDKDAYVTVCYLYPSSAGTPSLHRYDATHSKSVAILR